MPDRWQEYNVPPAPAGAREVSAAELRPGDEMWLAGRFQKVVEIEERDPVTALRISFENGSLLVVQALDFVWVR